MPDDLQGVLKYIYELIIKCGLVKSNEGKIPESILGKILNEHNSGLAILSPAAEIKISLHATYT